MRQKILVLSIVVLTAVLLLIPATSGAVPKPPPTTVPPPAPVQVLGVPHLVEETVDSTTIPGWNTGVRHYDVSCPSGEVALSRTIAATGYPNVGDYVSDVDGGATPILTDSRQTGYRFYINEQRIFHATVLCAALVNVQSAPS